jgi:cytochrome c oxidase subunit 4
MLTALTVAVSGVDLKRLSVLTALAVACIKTSLVLGIFMHLKYEDRIFKVMFLVVVVTLAIFIGLTFTDTTLAR